MALNAGGSVSGPQNLMRWNTCMAASADSPIWLRVSLADLPSRRGLRSRHQGHVPMSFEAYIRIAMAQIGAEADWY